ncbi:uncharacterized protein zgc:113176 [Simochromis diagramma]|uniref:uncharacterized protein zgc:113176 n=1 Tax=Simochromis diagramma TaxID=43689 RepID=UPI001A7E9073|nr:uncharacterized protein zgc:113176 [Simochromis diagramma]
MVSSRQAPGMRPSERYEAEMVSLGEEEKNKYGEEAAALKDETQQLSPELRELHTKKLLKQIMSELDGCLILDMFKGVQS